ncbi:MAG: OmpA family protein [Desulfobacterales bacterium]|nr:OmpA family protein [Desulfobacterales bacterium]
MRIFTAVFFMFLMSGSAYGIGDKTQNITGSDNQTVTTDDGDVSIKKNYYQGIPPEQFQKLSEELGVTKSALKSFFRILEQKRVSPEDLDSTLREIAKRHREFQKELDAFQSDDPKVDQLRSKAKLSLNVGNFDLAEKYLKEADKVDQDAIEKIEEILNKRKASRSFTKSGLQGFAHIYKPSVTMRLRFRKNSHELTSGAIAVLQNLGKALQSERLRNYVYRIEGHTSDLGSDAYNLALSRQRALSVRNYIVNNFDLPAEQFDVQGFGERFPLVPNEDENTRKINCRIVIKNTLITFTK